MEHLPPLLTSVAVVLHERPAVEQLPHVGELLSAFLDRRTALSLARACAFGSLGLLDRIWEMSPTAANTESWSLRQFLRSDRHYNRHQFSKSLVQAAKRGDLQMLLWLFAHFSGCLAEVEVVEAAAEGGYHDILEFLWANGHPLLLAAERRSFVAPEAEANANLELHREHSVEWGRHDAVRAAQNGHNDVVWWLLRTVHGAERELDEVVGFADTHGEIPQVKWMLQHGLPERGEAEPVAGRLDALQWLFDQDYRSDVSETLELAAGNGHLELVEWLIQKDRSVVAGAAMEAACENGHSAVVEYFCEHGLADGAERALHEAASNNHLAIADYLLERGLTGDVMDTMFAAAEKGHLDAVKWLYEHFADKPEVRPFPEPSFCMNPQDGPARQSMDVAAQNGHLEVLQFLHSIDDGEMEERVRKRQRGDRETVLKWWPMCSRNAMDRAALNGHLNVIKWLDQNRSEGFSHVALLLAVCGGHTDVVEWLLERSSNDLQLNGRVIPSLVFIRTQR